MNADPYERWISQEILESGFREPLWTEALQQSQGDSTQARLIYLKLRHQELVQAGVEIPALDDPAPSKVPKRPPPPSFFEDHPKLVRIIGFLIAGGFIAAGIKLMRLSLTMR